MLDIDGLAEELGVKLHKELHASDWVRYGDNRILQYTNKENYIAASTELLNAQYYLLMPKDIDKLIIALLLIKRDIYEQM